MDVLQMLSRQVNTRFPHYMHYWQSFTLQLWYTPRGNAGRLDIQDSEGDTACALQANPSPLCHSVIGQDHKCHRDDQHHLKSSDGGWFLGLCPWSRFVTRLPRYCLTSSMSASRDPISGCHSPLLNLGLLGEGRIVLSVRQKLQFPASQLTSFWPAGSRSICQGCCEG